MTGYSGKAAYVIHFHFYPVSILAHMAWDP